MLDPRAGGSSLPFGVIPSLVRLEADAHAQLRQLASTSEGMVSSGGSSTDHHDIDEAGEGCCQA